MKVKLFLLSVLLCGAFNQLFAQLPSVTLKDIDGKTVDTATLSNDGKPFIISFFATWCKPCNRELKAIHEVYPDWQDETGVRLIAVSVDEGQNIQKVKPMVNAAGWEFYFSVLIIMEMLRCVCHPSDKSLGFIFSCCRLL